MSNALVAATIAEAGAVPAVAMESEEQSDKSWFSNLQTKLYRGYEGKKGQQHIKNI